MAELADALDLGSSDFGCKGSTPFVRTILFRRINVRICRRILEHVQVFNPEGSIRLCSWLRDNTIGKLSENTIEEIWNGEKARSLRERLASGDYSLCNIDCCPYLSNGNIDDILVEIDEIPQYPTHLLLGYEMVCNYKCTCCSTHIAGKSLRDFKLPLKEAKMAYGIIEERLKPVLPHLKHIGANGLAELFMSKHILKQLSEWRPIAPPEECSVSLETNGSLFDEQHWKQIENLGQYKLSVAISVMSFDEHIYQVLSGCNYPITRIENNLRFVKKLREQGIINHLTIATVVQERNFHTMPEFARRCVEEFGADYVRLYPYVRQYTEKPEVGWFMDVRGAYHPYHEEYKEMMKDPIFKNPKVHDWGGGRDSQTGDLPQNIMLKNLQTIRQTETCILGNIIINDELLLNLAGFLKSRGGGIVYGAGAIGISIAKKLSENCQINFIVDLNLQGNIGKIPIISPNDVPAHMHSLDVIFTDLQMPTNIPNLMREAGYSGQFIGLGEIFPFLFPQNEERKSIE